MSHIEIEAKMRLDDVAALEAKLAALGAQRAAVLHETNTFFDTDRQTLKSGDRGLRVRIERDVATGQSTVRITHKGPRAHGRLKSRPEVELTVDDAHAAAKLLGALGFHPVLGFEKLRRRWVLDGCRVELDRLPYLGDFVEIEGPSDKAVLATREKLGLADKPMLQTSYIAMLSNHLREQSIVKTHVPLDANGEPA